MKETGAQTLVVLPEDIQIVPLADLPPQLREQVEGEDGDFAITRPLSRTPSKVIDRNAAALLKHFEKPTTIVDALLKYSRDVRLRPHEVLEEAYPFIESCLVSKLLVHPGADAGKIQPCFAAGDRIADYLVDSVVQALEDSEVYRVLLPSGAPAALKIGRLSALDRMEWMLESEERILKRLDGVAAPQLLASGKLEDQRRFLVMEWIGGVDAYQAVQRIREQSGTPLHRELLDLCVSILDAYAVLHQRAIIHSDVHPRNILVSEDGGIKLIDFGVARIDSAESPAVPRAGMGYFFEPEYAAMMRSRNRAVPSSIGGEQYGLAALLYFLLSGAHYLDFSIDKDEMLRQIAEDDPVPFKRRGLDVDANVESVLFRALAKEPSMRYRDTAEFAASFRSAAAGLASPAISSAPDPCDCLLDRVLDRLSRRGAALDYKGPASPTASLTYGAAGIGYALYRIACARDDARLFALADFWTEKASALASHENAFYCDEVQITPQIVGRVSPYHTSSGIAAVHAVLSAARGSRTEFEQRVSSYVELASDACDNLDLTLGRSSVVLGLTLMLEALGPPLPQPLVDHGTKILAGIWDQLDREPPIRDGKNITYLGIAHGWAGLIYTALRWTEVSGTPMPPGVPARLAELAALTEPAAHRGARWPVQVGARGMYMSGWCNGSAGYVHLWTLAHRLLGDASYLQLAERAGADAWESADGGHSLCCGFAGQAYSLLNLYRRTGERSWLDRARRLAQRAASLGNALLESGEPTLPFSLYKGDLGVAVLVAELEAPAGASMPFFEPDRLN
jgi:eukaryotic-like serine/threonine-protein kinase